MGDEDVALGFRVAQLERRVNGIPEKIAVFEVRLVEIGTGLSHLERGQEKAREAIEAEMRTVKEALERREAEKARERKADRKWLVGTGLTSAALVVTALALLGPNL